MPAWVTRLALLPAVVLLLALLPASAEPARAQAPQAVPITVVVRGLRSDRGHVRVGLYVDPAEWPHDHGAIARCSGAVHDRVARCTVVAPRPGRYAFAFLHDENDDTKMNSDMLGIPQEGYGFSNDVRPGIGGAPSFQSASFQAAGPTEKSVTARYGI